MAKLACKLVKGKPYARKVGKTVKDATGLTFNDLQNGTGTFDGQDAQGNEGPLDPSIWSISGDPTITPDTTVISSVTVSGFNVTFVGTGKTGTPTVGFVFHTSDGSQPDTTVDVPVAVAIDAATNKPVFKPGTPVVR